MTRLAEWLSYQLKEREWSGREFAERIATSPTTVAKTLNGEAVPSAKILNRMARALEVPVSTILEIAGHLPPESNPGDDPSLRELVRLYNVLSDDDQDTVLVVARALAHKAIPADS